MPVKQKGFSLLEVLIAMTISSILLLSTSRFLPGLQRGVLLQSGQRELEASRILCRALSGARVNYRQARAMCNCAMGCKQQRPVG